LGAEVIRTKGKGASVGAVPQAVRRMVSRKISLRKEDIMEILIPLKFDGQNSLFDKDKLGCSQMVVNEPSGFAA
jgi:hypothetical protein